MMLKSKKNNQFSLSVVLYSFVPAFVVIASILLISVKTKIPIYIFTKDTAAAAKVKSYTGVLSNIGILFWCATAAICFFSYSLLKQRGDVLKTFFLHSALITTFLLFDDMFQIHEGAAPIYWHIPEKIILGVYVILIVLFFVKYKNTILGSPYYLLALSLFFFGLSIGFDLLSFTLPGHFLFEDGSKFLGITGWFTYFSQTSFNSLIIAKDN